MKNKSIVGYFGLAGMLIMIFLVNYPKMAFRQDEVSDEIESEFGENEIEAIFKNHKVVVPNDRIWRNIGGEVLADNDYAVTKKRIEIDLTNQKLYGFENDKKVHEYLISSGTWNRTPTGKFKIWTMIKSQKMSGGSKELGTYYYLPNVPNILFFYNSQVERKIGYSIHGAYWHNNFGKPMSHGCINMSIEESKVIFEWADKETEIEIYGKMPIIQLPWAES